MISTVVLVEQLRAATRLCDASVAATKLRIAESRRLIDSVKRQRRANPTTR